MRGRDDAAGEATPPSHPDHPHHHHPHLIDADEDRWKWRAKIRRDPRKLFFYRIGVALGGLVLMVGAVLTGPLPGPGGIPLFLLGLAVWASEFEWAQDVMLWFKRLFHRYLQLPRSRRILCWVVVIACAWAGAYAMMLAFGPPAWTPELARQWLRRLPGL